MKPPAKRMGRPPLSPTGEVGTRYQAHLPPSVADKLRAYGNGSLSAGIVKAATKLRKPSD